MMWPAIALKLDKSKMLLFGTELSFVQADLDLICLQMPYLAKSSLFSPLKNLFLDNCLCTDNVL